MSTIEKQIDLEVDHQNEIESQLDRSYHDRPELCSSEVAMFLQDPIKWFHVYKLGDWEVERTKPMRLGTTVHDMLEYSLPIMMQRKGWESIVKEIPRDVLNADGHCKGNAWKLWQLDNPAEIYYKPGEENPLRLVWDHIMANTFCRELVECGDKEQEHYWTDEDLGDCRIKTDVIHVRKLADWKTTCKREARAFAADAFTRSYDVRLALYRRGFRNMFGFDPEVYVVAICTSGSMAVTPYRMPDSWLEDAEAKLLLTVDEMRHFSLGRYLDCAPVELVQPRYAVLDLETVE